MQREQVLRAIESSPETFLKLLESHESAEEDIDLCEFLQALPRKQHGRVWNAVLQLAHGIVGRLEKSEGELHDDPSVDKGECEDVDLLRGVVTMCRCALSLESIVITAEFTNTLQILHDILLSVPEEWCEVQNEMSAVCEMCWGRGEEVEGREEMVPNCLLYLVALTFSQGATLRDVGRVWAMRGAFLLLDFEDTSAESIKELLLHTLIEPLYLTSTEGKKLLSFLFGLHPSFVEDLHQAIKNQLLWCPKPYLEVYGEVYFKAWRLASGPYLKQLEERCLQDLMYMAVHAQRTGPNSLFAALRKLLGYIHQQGQHSGVSAMLLRLYSPFLWRSLKVANSHVRANAVCLMLDAFPLLDPRATREECDVVLQKQFDLMKELLFDPSPMVRSLTILGVGRVLCRYWEMVPQSVIKSLLQKTIQELAYDTASDNVRVAVIQSLCIILENRLSHSVLRGLLPLLRNHVHDISVKVRIAFLDMLLLVSGIRTIKFYEVCPVEDLLARMEGDESIHVVKRVVSLLKNSFRPSNVPLSGQVARCLTLLEMNTSAGRKFYQMAVGHLSLSHTVRFMLALHKIVKHFVEEGGVEREGGGEGVETKKRKGKKAGGEDKHLRKNFTGEGIGAGEGGEGGEGEHGEDGECGGGEGDPIGIVKGGWKEEDGNGEENKSTTDPLSLDLIAGVLEVLVILWEGVRETLTAPKQRELRTKLESTVTESLPLLFNALTDGRCRSALYFIASYLPMKSVSAIVRGTLETLSSLEPSSQDYSAMLLAMTSWKQTGHVISLISQWLTAPLCEGLSPGRDGEVVAPEPRQNHTKRRGRKVKKQQGGKAGGGVDSSRPQPKPELALNIFNYMMLHPLCCEEMKKLKETWELEKTLQKCLDVLEDRFSSSCEATPPVLTFDLLRQALSVYVRLAMHKEAESAGDGGGCDVVRERVREVVKWSSRALLPLLRGDIPQSAKRHSNRKRKANQSQASVVTSDPRTNKACQLTVMLLELTTETVIVGLSDGELQLEIAQWAAAIAESASAPTLLRPLSKLLYQLSEASVFCEVDGIHTTLSLAPAAALLQPLLQLASAAASSGPDEFKKVWSQLHVCVCHIVTMSRLYTLSISLQPIPTLTTLTNITMSSLVDKIKERPVSDLPWDVASLPLFPSSVVQGVYQLEETASLFASHIHSWLEGEGEEEGEDIPFSDCLLRHQAALHALSALSTSQKGSEEVMRCLDSTQRLIERKEREENTQWSGQIAHLSQAIELIRDRLSY